MARVAAMVGALGAGGALAILVTGAAAGCDVGSRFPVCQTNADCAARDGGTLGNVCYNLRCVECHYDTDCGSGQVCGSANTCDRIHDRDEDAGPDEHVEWNGTWDDCARGCADPACIKRCNDKFGK